MNILKNSDTIAVFERFDIEMTRDQALSASHSGSCDNNVKEVLKDPKIKEQLKKISDGDLISVLKDYGAWDTGELSSRESNEERIIWIAACNIREDITN